MILTAGGSEVMINYAHTTRSRIKTDLDSLMKRGKKVLKKYGVSSKKLGKAAEMYARTFKMLYEQNGCCPLNRAYEEEIERRIVRAVSIEK